LAFFLLYFLYILFIVFITENPFVFALYFLLFVRWSQTFLFRPFLFIIFFLKRWALTLLIDSAFPFYWQSSPDTSNSPFVSWILEKGAHTYPSYSALTFPTIKSSNQPRPFSFIRLFLYFWKKSLDPFFLFHLTFKRGALNLFIYPIL
jgi:hypothetical protein